MIVRDLKGVKRMNWNRSLPSGTKDKLFKEAHGAFSLEHRVGEVLADRGYQRVETPVIEFEDVFGSNSSHDPNLYRFFDRQGRLLVLRPDMTQPIGRVVATTGVKPPLQLFYSGKIFRANSEMRGEQNEQSQAGIELIGYSSIKAEIECIVCAQKVLAELQIENYQIELGHAKIYYEILKELALSEEEQAVFKRSLLNKNISDLKDFVIAHPSSLDEFIRALPTLFGEIEETVRRAQKMVDNPVILKALAELATINEGIQQSDNQVALTVDISLVPSMDYYSGTIFKGYADSIPDSFLGGGRYNHLQNQFGNENQPSVGLAFNLDTLVRLQSQLGLIEKKTEPLTLIHYDLADFALAEELMTKTAHSKLSFFDNLSDSLAFAKKWSYQEVLLITTTGVEIFKLEGETR